MTFEILKNPDERLRRKADAVACFDGELKALCEKLEATMRAGPGGVGLAAPQVGISRRIVIVDCTQSLRPCKNHGGLYMINPQVLSSAGDALGREGCLSVPEWVGMVPRAKTIQVSFQYQYGKSCR